MIDGFADEGYGAVADAFRRNFARRNELGAACAVVLDGRLVVDLWGGHRDPRRTQAWQRDTMVPVFSTTKGMASIAMAVAHSRCLFELDEPVVSYWPEFGQCGKDGVTVRQLLAHEAGLAAIDVPLDLDILADHDRLGEILAAQVPNWPPGRHAGYHGISLGWYESQLLRRVDPQRRTIGRFFADEVAEPLDLDFHIGVPDDVPDERLARFVGGRLLSVVLHAYEMPLPLILAFANPRSLTSRTFRNPRALGSGDDVNRRELLRLEMPSVTGTGSARAIAAAYGELAIGGGRCGITRRTLDELEAPAPARPDVVLRSEAAYSFGFMKPTTSVPFGSSPRAYGHDGVGGSIGFADPDRRLGYAYVMNRAGYGMTFDPRDVALRAALYAALG